MIAVNQGNVSARAMKPSPALPVATGPRYFPQQLNDFLQVHSNYCQHAPERVPLRFFSHRDFPMLAVFCRPSPYELA